MVGGPEFGEIVIEAATFAPTAPDGNPLFYIAAAGIAIGLVACDRPAKRRTSKRRRELDDVFGEGTPDFLADDEDEIMDDEQIPIKLDKMHSETTMHRGFVFSFRNSANDPVAIATSDHKVTNLVSKAGRSRAPQQPAISHRSPSPSGRKWRTARMAFGVLLALGCFARGLWSSSHLPAQMEPSARSATAAPLRPIEDIRVGDRVITDLPSRMSSETAVDPTTWRLVILRGDARNDDGTHFGYVDVETLQPPEWIQEQRAELGARVHFPLDLVEMGLSNELAATVMAIEPCRPVQPGPGRVVLTTVGSPSNSVMELSLRNSAGKTETIRPTAGHRFYSEDRQEWLPAKQLSVGEQIRGMNGTIVVDSSRRVAGIRRVFNMTVETDHRYHVSNLAILSHNDGPCPDLPVPPKGGSGGPTINVDPNRYPGSAQNLNNAGATNRPLPVNRPAAAGNRAAALAGTPTVPGMDRDEAPPAVLRNPGDPVSVSYVPPGDNRGAGAVIGNGLRGVPDGGTVTITTIPGEK